MNETLTELAEQAGFKFFRGGELIADDGNLLRFAQKIVQKCVSIAFHNGDNVDYLTEYFKEES